METKELRIGNLLIIDDEITEAWSINDKPNGVNWSVDPNDGMDETYPKSVQPIPITEEWLSKFGFDHYRKTVRGNGLYQMDFYNHKNFTLIKNKRGIYHLVNVRHGKLEYVHQLQNLYFVITGEEL